MTATSTSTPLPRLTPWVGRLLAINAVILLLQQTIFTSPALERLLEFDPALAFQRPWTFVTYMFLHGGILHLAANSLALFVFGPAVESRFGSRIFLAYYLYCGIGAAIVTVIFGQMHLATTPFIGASGAIIGVAYAFARLLPDTPLVFLLVPIPIKAKWMIPLLVAYDLVGLLAPLNDGIAHGAHVGGLLAGVLYFVLRNIAHPADPMPLPSMRPRVPVAARGTGGGGSPAVHPGGAPHAEIGPAPSAPEPRPGDDEAAEIDRVLDKISALGIGALSWEERRFLDAVARRRRDTH